MQASPSLVGIDSFVSRLLSSVRLLRAVTKENPLQPTPPYPLSWTPVTAAAAIGQGEYAYGISELAPSLVNVSCSGAIRWC